MGKELCIFNDTEVDIPYGLKEMIEVSIPKTGLPTLDQFLTNLKISGISAEAIIDQVTRKVNSSLDYLVDGFQDRPTNIQSIELDPGLAKDYANKVLAGGYGRCEDAGAVIRTILKLILPAQFKVNQISIPSQVYDGTHDITFVYSPNGKLFTDSIRYQGHKGGVFSEENCPIKMVKMSELF